MIHDGASRHRGGSVMDIPVLVEQVGDKKFVARAGGPFNLCAEGKSHYDAVTKLEELLRKKLDDGARLDTVELPDPNPLMRYAGSLDPDDPAVQEWDAIIAENRRKQDEAEGIR